MSRSRKRVRRTRDQIEELLKSFEVSGSTQAVFARRHRLSVSTLQFWLARRRREMSAGPAGLGFVPVTVALPEDPGAICLQLELSRDRRLHIPSEIDCEALGRLLPIITRAC